MRRISVDIEQKQKTRLRRKGKWILYAGVAVFLFSQLVLFSPHLLDFLHTFQGTAVDSLAKPPEMEVQKSLPPPNVSLTPSLARAQFENGIVYPEWYPGGYSAADTTWQQGIITMQQQTHARWIEMPIQFSQDFNDSTQFNTKNAPSVVSFKQGVQAAKSRGYHVFVVPHLVVAKIPGAWSGSIQFSFNTDMLAWFANYWKAYAPYVQAAQEAGADQLAVGTELQWLQYNAPDPMWNALIARIHATYTGKLTYDTNFNTSIPQPPNWWRSPELSAIGISEYIPLEVEAASLSPGQFASLFTSQVKSYLDAYAQVLQKKPLIVTEIGYRNGMNPGYQPWNGDYLKGQKDPAAQSMAFRTAISTLVGDKNIHGIFIWGWHNTGAFDVSTPKTIHVINQQYSSPDI